MFARYLFGLLAARVSATLAVLCLIYALFDLGDAGRQLAATIGWSTVLVATLLRLPTFAAQLLPAALTLGGALTLAALHRRGELEALATLGAGPQRLARPLLAFGLLVAAGGALLGEAVAPPLEAHADQLYQHRRLSSLTGQRARRGRWRRQGRWLLRVDDKRVTALESGPSRLAGTGLRGPSGLTGRRIDGRLIGETLHQVRDVQLTDGDAVVRWHRSLELASLGLGGTAAQGPSGRAESQGVGELLKRTRAAQVSGHSRRLDRVLLHLRLSFPLLALPAALLLWALALRRGATLALAAAFVGALWLLVALGFLAARSGLVAPSAGPWGALAAAFAIGLLALWRRWPRARLTP
jgi:lipopolysaccharide export LptBFGC system permease protein LptF